MAPLFLCACQATSVFLPGAAGLGLSSGTYVGLLPAGPQLHSVRFRTLPSVEPWELLVLLKIITCYLPFSSWTCDWYGCTFSYCLVWLRDGDRYSFHITRKGCSEAGTQADVQKGRADWVLCENFSDWHAVDDVAVSNFQVIQLYLRGD